MSPRIVKRGEGDYPLVYRPCRMSEVYGQDEVKRTIAYSLDKGTLSHAVLFQGVSGTGKTSIGRIIAMGLNCKKGPTSEPCGECDFCKPIRNGNSLAFQEFDAGYFSGIDKMRAERQDFASGPMGFEKFKIILFDECHRYTEPVQNVLLKPIEDSRSHIYFIFCTTNPKRMIETLRNRCMQFEFKGLQPEELRKLLYDVCENENLEPDQVTIENIIQESKGMPRNALWLLQRAVGCGKLGSRVESMYTSFAY
jgi:DNA polymerase-3 subunit gamma/tau